MGEKSLLFCKKMREDKKESDLRVANNPNLIKEINGSTFDYGNFAIPSPCLDHASTHGDLGHPLSSLSVVVGKGSTMRYMLPWRLECHIYTYEKV